MSKSHSDKKRDTTLFFGGRSVIYRIKEINMKSLTQPALFTKMVIAEWDRQNNNFNKFLSSTTDQQLLNEIAPGKNTGIYLVGHLIAISDAMLPLLAFGEKLFPVNAQRFVLMPSVV